MGQYHYVCNLDKREYIDPHKLGDGLKLMEFGNSAGGVMTAVSILLAACNGRGGGDLRADDHPYAALIGSWAGHRLAIIGDYCEAGDIPGWDMSDTPWAEDNDWTEISAPMRELIEADGMFTFKEEEWTMIDLDGTEHKHVSVKRT